MENPNGKEILMPPECCGACRHCYHEVQGLVCYGGFPYLRRDESGDDYFERGAPVEADDYPCGFFKLRMHS